MRLSPLQIHATVAATAELAGPDALVRLFGSRLDDALRGGDIDLLVECPNKVARPVWLAAQITAATAPGSKSAAHAAAARTGPCPGPARRLSTLKRVAALRG